MIVKCVSMVLAMLIGGFTGCALFLPTESSTGFVCTFVDGFWALIIFVVWAAMVDGAWRAR